MERLTSTERKIARLMLDGRSIAAIARERGLAVDTVRWHVRNMSVKMSARNLADLQRILALSLPV